MSSSVEKIKERLSIVEVVSSYITLIPAGRNYKAKCPFHNEKTPSFFVSTDRNSYYCFGCGVKGDIFSFVQHFEGTDFSGALKLLASRAGIILENNFSREDKNQKDLLYLIMEEATVFYQEALQKENKVKDYLQQRGLSDQTIKSFRVGFAIDSWKSVSTYLIQKGFKKEDLEKVGLIKTKEANSFYDRFRSRIIFPISDSSGRTIAFSGRIFSAQGGSASGGGDSNFDEAKYLNSPETVLFSKSDTLFGIDKAKIEIKKRNYSILVEGQIDLILCHQAGFTNTIAVSGTALADRVNENESGFVLNQENIGQEKINNLGLIRRLSPNIILAFDGDSAGLRAVNRSALIALSLDMQVKVAVLPEGQDPADVILKDLESWKKIIKNSVNIIEFHLNDIGQSFKDFHQKGKAVKEIIFPFLAVIKSSIEKSAYFKMISSKIGISESAIVEDFDNYQKFKDKKLIQKDEEKIKEKKEVKTRKEQLEEKLMGIIFWKIEGKDQDAKEINKEVDLLKKEIGQENFDKIKDKYKKK
jgi:DNA primase